MKMYILICKDTFKGYSLGKVIVHCCHNAEDAVRIARSWDAERCNVWWRDHDRTKIVVWVKTRDALEALCKEAVANRIPAAMTEDVGRYEVSVGTIIGGAIGPCSDDEARRIGLKKLRLFK